MNCKHNNTRAHEASRDVAGLKFEYSTVKCQDCDAVLWSPENETEWQRWLVNQKEEHRDKFFVQKLAIPTDLIAFAQDLADEHGTAISNVYQAALACYFVYAPKKGWLEALDSDFFASTGPTTSVGKVEVNPQVFVKIDSNAKLFDLARNAVASWAISRVLRAAVIGRQLAEQQAAEEAVAFDMLAAFETALAA